MDRKRAEARPESRSIFLPLAVSLMHRVLAREGDNLSDKTALDIEHQVEDLVLEDDEFGRRIREVAMRLKPVPVEPDGVLWLRASIRPVITLLLTALFLGLVAAWVLVTEEARAEAIKEVFPVFLGIYGAVIGFWFGEHTAEKAHARQLEDRAGDLSSTGRARGR